jgi:predicted nucleotidyltransferase
MFLMNKEAGNGPRAGVEVLVGAPGGHVHSPVMEVKLNVTSGMGQVKTNMATLRERGRERERERGGGHLNF